MDEGGTGPGAAVVGTGFGCITHVRALRQAGVAVHALVGRDPERTARRAARHDIPLATTSLAEALACPGVEIVSVATPPLTHAPLVLEAIAAGRHVVCEKPFAADVTEARTMLQAAESAGVVHLLGTEFRFATAQALLARTVRSGAVGQPVLATFVLDLPLLADPDAEVPAWWSDAAQGGGWLGAYASHVVDQIRITLGEFEVVSATLPTVSDHPTWTADDAFCVHFRLESGVDGVMMSSSGGFGPPVAVTRVEGRSGTAWIDGDQVWVGDRSGASQVPVPDDLALGAPVPPDTTEFATAYDYLHASGIDLDPYARLFAVARDRVLGRPVADDPPAGTFADGVAIQAVLDAIRRSAAERRSVRIDEI